MIFPERFNLCEYLLEDQVDAGKGDRVALVSEGRTWTYEQLTEQVAQMAWVLRQNGISVEDRVLIALPDCVSFVTTFLATLKLGAVVTMMNPELSDEDYRYYLAYTRARFLVCEQAHWDRIGAVVARAKFLRGHLRRGHNLEETRAKMPRWIAGEDTSRDDPAIWLFTSGSTGRPKAAVHLQHDFAYNIEAYAKQILGFKEDDVTLSVPKLFFGYATGMNLMFPLSVGASAVLFEEKATPEKLFELIELHRPTVLTSVPTMIGKMLAAEGAAGRDLSSLRVTVSAGEALPEPLYRRWTETFKSEILDGIGSAEMFHIYISNRFGAVRPGSVGQLVPGYDAKLVDDDGREVAEGEIGTLWIKGDSAAVYYVDDHEKSKQVLRGDWVVTGDKMSRDAEGYFYYAGRADDLIKVGGIFVAPVEVEAVLAQHAAVLECCVVGYEDEGKLIKAKAVVVLRPGFAPGPAIAEGLIELARAKLAAHKVPRRVEFAPELPRSDRGKVLRAEVK